MTDLRQAAQQARQALETLMIERESIYDKAITALNEALAQEHAMHELARLGQEIEQAEPPPEWPLIKNILAEYGLSAICFVAEWKAAQQQAEPTCPECKAKVLFECVACSSNNYPPKRPWVDLTDGDWEWVADKKETSLDTFAHGAAWAAYKLERRNT